MPLQEEQKKILEEMGLGEPQEMTVSKPEPPWPHVVQEPDICL
jgi:hypothetical protein